jgi:hypothetical protein
VRAAARGPRVEGRAMTPPGEALQQRVCTALAGRQKCRSLVRLVMHPSAVHSLLPTGNDHGREPIQWLGPGQPLRPTSKVKINAVRCGAVPHITITISRVSPPCGASNWNRERGITVAHRSSVFSNVASSLSHAQLRESECCHHVFLGEGDQEERFLVRALPEAKGSFPRPLLQSPSALY